MEPLAHTLLGATLAHLASPASDAARAHGDEEPARARRILLFAGVAAANVPDVDVLAYLAGSDFALGFRRGITHGVLAMGLWPLLLTALFAAWTGGRGVVGQGRLATVVALGCWSHPVLDWLNDYGIRLLMPFEQRWFYGDVAFIVDPWMWLLLGGGLVLGRAPAAREARRWAALALICGLAVAVSPTPVGARVVWVVAAAVLLVVAGRRSAWSRSPAAFGLGLFALYVGSLLGVERVSRGRVVEAIRADTAFRETTARDLLVGPTPMDPLTWQVVARAGGRYVTGSYRLPAGLVVSERIEAEEAASGRALAEIDSAWSAPEAAGFARWVRFPFHREVDEAEGRFLYLLDARYTTQPTSTFGGVRLNADRMRRYARPEERSP